MNCLQKSLTILLIVVSTLCFTGCSKNESGKNDCCCNESPIVIEDNNSFKNEVEQLKEVQENIIAEQIESKAKIEEKASEIAEEIITEKALKDAIAEEVTQTKEKTSEK
jgi:hypothetical protein